MFREEPPERLDMLARTVIGAAIEVHRHLGPGFLEGPYEEALVVELGLRGFEVRRQVAVPIIYKGSKVADARLDLIVEEELVLEIKSVEHLVPVHHAQLRSYLRATNLQLGLLINFNVDVLRNGVRRVIHTV